MRITRCCFVVALLTSAIPSVSAAVVLDAEHGSAALEPSFTQITCRVATNQGSFGLSDGRYRRSVGQMPANDPFGKQPWQTIEAKDRRGVLDLRLMLRSDDRGHLVAKVWLANRSAKPLRLGSLAIEATRPGDWHGGRVLRLWHFEQEELPSNCEKAKPSAASTRRPPTVRASPERFSARSITWAWSRLLPGAMGCTLWPLATPAASRFRPAGSARASRCGSRPAAILRPNWKAGPIWPAVGTTSASGRETLPPGVPGIPA